MEGASAVAYHERTKHSPASVRESDFSLDFNNKPLPYKLYLDRRIRDLADRIRPSQQPALRAIAESRANPLVETDQSPPPLDEATVTELCYFSAGITKNLGDRELSPSRPPQSRERFLHAVQPLFHAAACTGKLYHVDLYLVCGDLDGLPAGVYHFDPLTCSLDVLREGDYRGVAAAASGDAMWIADAPLTVVTTSTWWRNAWKYRERTFRHAFWDSGTILANLLAVAHGRDLPAQIVTGFADQRLADLLGIDPTQEAPLELVAIGAGDGVPEPRAVPALETETYPLSPDPVDYPLIHEAWRAGSLADRDAVQSWRARFDDEPVGTRAPGDGERVPLAPVVDENVSKAPISLTIRRRGSCREYLREAVSFRKVSTILDRAVRGLPMDVRGHADGPLRFVDCYVIAAGIDGLPDGSYQYHPAAGELERLVTGTFRREAGHLALDQRLAADAALNVYFLTDVDAIVAELGDRGYRIAQLEAATTAGRLQLATYAHRDLGGTGLTFYDDAVTDFFGPRAGDQTPMFLYTLGRPA